MHDRRLLFRVVHRRFLTCVLSVFLLLMQQESLRHALDHVGAQLQRIEYSMLERPTGDTCVECGLLAGGAHSIASAPPAPFAAAVAWLAVSTSGESRAAVAPSWYQTRAPPRSLQYA